ncbi:MAG: permease [Candidatus Micrarchaeia archaeon]
MDFSLLFIAGLSAIWDYIALHTLFCLIPAFFIAGAMSALIPKDLLLPYLGKKASNFVSYPIAVLAGLLLAVCSCTVLPLFAGIRKSGAGIGPAIAFLYTAPATNILAITYTSSLIGWDIALWRIAFSIVFAIAIGIIIDKIFKDEDVKAAANLFGKKKKDKNTVKRLLMLFVPLVAILLAGTRLEEGIIKYAAIAALVAATAFAAKKYYTREEIDYWMSESWRFFAMIFPMLVAGVFIAGVLGAALPADLVAQYVGNNGFLAVLIPVVFGLFMYFPTLVEVPMAKTFLELGMAKGPLLAYLLADPVISLPSMLAVNKIMGTHRTIVYAGLILVFTVAAGLLYGAIAA